MDKWRALLSGLISDPDRGLLIVILALVAIIGVLFTKIPEKYKIAALVCLFVVASAGLVVRYETGDDGPARYVHYYGYFADVKPDQSPWINSESINLRITNNRISGESTSEEPSDDGKMHKKAWSYEGITGNKGYALGYKTLPSEEDENPLGMGFVLAEAHGGSRLRGQT